VDESKHTKRPQLFSLDAAGGDSRRILASLEQGSRPDAPATGIARLRPGQLALGLGLLMLVACALAWMSYIGMNAPLQPPDYIAARQEPQVSEPHEVERLAAAIVNQPLPAMAPAVRRPAPVQPPASAAADEARAAAKPAPHGTAADAPAQLATRTPAGAPPRTTMPAAARAQGNDAHAIPPSVTTVADNDVALLAALVAYPGRQPLAMEHNRDVVERLEGDSTPALLRRCQRLGGAEANLCRARICSGQWLHEAACRTANAD
jgi:hypothetical protein